MVNYFEMTRADYDNLFAPAPVWEIPHMDDNFVQVDNIITFLNENHDTDQQVGFQGDGAGKFYVKASSNFGGNNASDPNIKGTGTLIFDAGKAAPTSSGATNYPYAAHLANVMNYILYHTRGSSYGSSTPLFTDEYKSSGNYYTLLDSTTMSKGFYYAYGNGSNFDCYGKSCAGYYSGHYVRSGNTNAVWW